MPPASKQAPPKTAVIHSRVDPSQGINQLSAPQTQYSLNTKLQIRSAPIFHRFDLKVQVSGPQRWRRALQHSTKMSELLLLQIKNIVISKSNSVALFIVSFSGTIRSTSMSSRPFARHSSETTRGNHTSKFQCNICIREEVLGRCMSSIQVGEALSCNDTPAVTLSDWLSEKAKCWIWNKDMEQTFPILIRICIQDGHPADQ